MEDRTRYAFLLRCSLEGGGSALYSAWFHDPDVGGWRLVSRLRRPKTSVWLSGLYSFLESFKTGTGDIRRTGFFGGHRVRAADGEWLELREAFYTGDSIARSGQRLDFSGGVEGGDFCLSICGFFDGGDPLDRRLDRPASALPAALSGVMPD